MDFNVDYMTAVKVYEYTDQTIHYADEIRLTNSNTEDTGVPGSIYTTYTTSIQHKLQILLDNIFHLLNLLLHNVLLGL